MCYWAPNLMKQHWIFRCPLCNKAVCPIRCVNIDHNNYFDYLVIILSVHTHVSAHYSTRPWPQHVHVHKCTPQDNNKTTQDRYKPLTRPPVWIKKSKAIKTNCNESIPLIVIAGICKDCDAGHKEAVEQQRLCDQNEVRNFIFLMFISKMMACHHVCLPLLRAKKPVYNAQQ